MQEIIVRKKKFNGFVKSEWEGTLLTSLEADWLVVLHHPERHKKSRHTAVLQADQLFIHLHNLVEPLTVLMMFDENGRFQNAKCDAALPAQQMENIIEFVDLDLDLHVTPNLSYTVEDEDVFQQHCKLMDYTPYIVQQARLGIKFAQDIVAMRRFPFDENFVPQCQHL